MQELILFADVMYDGFMAGKELHSPITNELRRRAGTIVMGQKAFSEMAAYWFAVTDPLPSG